MAALTKAITRAGGKPVKQPTFSFPVTDQAGFLKLAYILENTGVGAYNGAGPSLVNKTYLAAAGSIVQVGVCHAASIALPTGSISRPTVLSTHTAEQEASARESWAADHVERSDECDGGARDP